MSNHLTSRLLLTNNTATPAHTLVVGFYSGRGSINSVRLANGQALQPNQTGRTFGTTLRSPLAPGHSIGVAWSSTHGSVGLRETLWSAEETPPETSIFDSSDEVKSFVADQSNFQLHMQEWLTGIENPTTQTSAKTKRQQKFFRAVECEVHPQSPSTSTKDDAETLTPWLRERNRQRALAAREGRPLGGSPMSRTHESQPLASEIRSAAVNLEAWLFKHVETLAGGSEDSSEQALALSEAFDSFCVGELRWAKTSYGIPDSPQVALFAEMAILFRQLGLHESLWLRALPALVRGVAIYQEMAWTGAGRFRTEYAINCYLEASEDLYPTTPPSVRVYPTARLEGLRHHYSTQRVASTRQTVGLELTFGSMCLSMLRDTLMSSSIDDSDASVASATHATIERYVDDLVANPILIPSPPNGPT